MLKSYLLVALRNLFRNRVFSFINIAGLSLGISASLVIFLIVHYEFSFDKFHPDGGSIYRVIVNLERPGDRHADGGVPLPLIEAVKNEVTGVRSVVPMIICDKMPTVVPNPAVSGGKPALFRKQSGIIFTDEDYFDITPYTWLAGSARGALTGPGKVVLTAERASEYFPNASPSDMIGRTVIYFDSVPMTVTGVVANLRENTDFTFQEFLSRQTMSGTDLAAQFPLHDWGARSSFYELLLRLDKQPSNIERQMQQLLRQHDPSANEGRSKMTFLLEPLRDLHLSDEYGSFGSVRHAHRGALYGLLLLAVLLTSLACINFINLTTAQASRRAKEIGIRKTVGGTRGQLFGQFLSETFVITAISALASLLLVPLLLRFFAGFIPPGVHFDWKDQPSLIGFLFVLVITVGFLSGVYPALVLSAFRPARVLGGQSSASWGPTRKSTLRRFLSVSQFVVAQLFLVFTMGLGWQIGSLLHEDHGFRTDAVLSIHLPSKTDSARRLGEVLAGRVGRMAGVESVSLAADPPLANSNQSAGTFTYPGGRNDIETNVQLKYADTNYLRLYRIGLLAGRNVLPSDTIREFVINETYARTLGFARPKDALGKLVYTGTSGHRGNSVVIVGVMKDFQTHFLMKPGPVALTAASKRSNTLHVVLYPQSAEGASWSVSIKAIKDEFRDIYADENFGYQFLDESIAAFYKGMRDQEVLLEWATGVTIFISCLGMLGLVIFTTSQRTKEMGIRKIMGATVTQIIVILSEDFIRLVVLATVIATSLGAIALHFWMRNFSERTLPPLWLFPAAAFGMIGLAMLILGWQTRKAAGANPVESLRAE